MAPHLYSAAAILMASLAAAKTCTNLTIPVDISSRQGTFKKIPVEGNLDVTTFSQEFTKLGQNYTQVLLEGYQTLTGSYQISARYCRPDSGLKSDTIQLLTHGIGFDKTYWDLSWNNYNYSYVDVAVDAGYATLAIDRFGIGNSSHGDPFETVQAQAEVEALNAVTTKLRLGSIPEINSTFNKVVHVGHSFGSVQSYWLSALYPNNTDGLILTGWSANGSFLPTIVVGWHLHSARLNQPLRFGNASNSGLLRTFRTWSSGNALIQGVQSLLRTIGVALTGQDIWSDIATTEVFDLIDGYNTTVVQLNYPSGYITWSDLTAEQFAFLQPGQFDVGLALAGEATKQPVTVGELLTIGSSPPMTSFGGPVLVIAGETDLPFCGGDCFANGGAAVSIPAAAKPLFPNTSAFEAYIQPNTAHGLNFHYNATAGYQVVQNWLGAHGLGA